MKYLFWTANMGNIYLLKNIKKYCVNYYDYDYMIYADHDIIIDSINNDNDILNCDYSRIFETKIDDRQIMMISFDQYPDNRHYPKVYADKNKIEITKCLIIKMMIICILQVDVLYVTSN